MKLRLYYARNFEKVLDLVLDVQDKLSFENFPKVLVTPMLKLCKRILLEVGNIEDPEDKKAGLVEVSIKDNKIKKKPLKKEELK